MLADRLAASGIDHVLTREPGGTRTGEALRNIVLHGEDISGETELLVMLAARASHIHEVVKPSLARGAVVVCDRFELSSFAYQGIGRGFGLDRVKTLNAFATGGLRPALTIVVDVPVEVGAKRRAASRPAHDRIERAGNAFHTQVAEAYRLLAREEENVVLVDGTPAPNLVQQQILQLLRERFPETFDAISG